VQLFLNPSSKAMNGVGGVYTAIGKGGTLHPTFNPVTGDLNFSFSTLEEADLVLGVASFDGIMQMSIIVPGDRPRMKSSTRSVLNPDGSERDVVSATEAQLRELTDRFNAAGGIMTTFVVSVDVQGNLSYEFVAGDTKTKMTGTIPP
jgi:hypothetical protein